ncbi:hypothetical protein CKF48_14840 [Cytobacillus kochii]|uniref:Uncharacterized protein n=1 Tax=Cytobacillus kochii TaxID=859143 RepID=A0A248TJR2_9BACI|nr:hypothetical protein CKF48_14840 [Cytobacillus kochii]
MKLKLLYLIHSLCKKRVKKTYSLCAFKQVRITQQQEEEVVENFITFSYRGGIYAFVARTNISQLECGDEFSYRRDHVYTIFMNE